tara:strand:- start:14648 stop:15295 length:648 start_codon:yes stop_codon:yes gene_type:complete
MGYEIGDEFDDMYEIGDGGGEELVGYDDEDDEDEELEALLGASPWSRLRSRGRSRRSAPSRRRAAPRRRVSKNNYMQRARAQAMAVREVNQGTLLKKTGPTKSREFAIGFDSGTTIAAGASATLTQRPQIIFRPERIVVPASLASFFLINDVKVGKNSQLVSAGAIPAATFSETAFGVRLKMDTVQISQDLIMLVTNIDVGAQRFLGAMIGESVE